MSRQPANNVNIVPLTMLCFYHSIDGSTKLRMTRKSQLYSPDGRTSLVDTISRCLPSFKQRCLFLWLPLLRCIIRKRRDLDRPRFDSLTINSKQRAFNFFF